MSDITLASLLPPEALAPAQARLPAVPGPPALDGPPPAGRAGAAPDAEGGTDAFAALLQGFWASAQPVAPLAAPVPATTPAQAVVADASLTQPGLPATAPLPLAAGAAPPAASAGGAVAGTSLPLTGKGLPAGTPGEPGAGLDDATPPALLPEPPPATAGTRPERISLADLEAGRQLGLATPPGRGADRADSLAGGSLDSDAPATPDNSTDAGALPVDADQPELPVRAPSPATPDFSRLVVELAASPARTQFAASPGTAEFQLAGTGLGAAPASAAADPGLRTALGSALQGFPALQPLGEPRAWTEGLGDRLLTLAGPGTHSARLKLHPESLGALDVEIRIDDGGAQVWFGTSHQQAREAIESSLPRLREMFADQGLNLIRAQVDTGAERRTPHQPVSPPDPDLAGSPASWSRRPAPAFSPAATGDPLSSRLLDVWA